MKKLLYIFFAAIIAVCFSSCKDEDDEQTVGTGGSLKGVWTMLYGDEARWFDLKISSDGRMQPLYDGVASGNAVGIIKKVRTSKLNVKGVSGDITVEYSLDEMLTVVDDRLSVAPVLTLDFPSQGGDDVVNASGSYIMSFEKNPKLDKPVLPNDQSLVGEWVNQFTGEEIVFKSGTGTHKNSTTRTFDWGIYKGQLVIHYKGYSTYSEYRSYSVSGDKLELNLNGTVQTFTRKSAVVTGNASGMQGTWIKVSKDSKGNITPIKMDGSYYIGVRISANGEVKVIKQSIYSGVVTEISSQAKFIITSASGKTFKGVNANGNVSGGVDMVSAFNFDGSKISEVTTIDISNFTSEFYLGSTYYTFSGSYQKTYHDDGTAVGKCIDKNLVGLWSQVGGYEIINLSDDGTGYIYSSGSDNYYAAAYYWGALHGNICLIQKDNESNNMILPYKISDNRLTIQLSESEVVYEK